MEYRIIRQLGAVGVLSYFAIINLVHVPLCNTQLVYNLTDCESPCRNGSYEVMPCSDSQPKICKGESQINLSLLSIVLHAPIYINI